MTALDQILATTGEVDGLSPDGFARGREAVHSALISTEHGSDAADRRHRPARKIVLVGIAVASAAAIAVPLAAFHHGAPQIDANRPVGSPVVGTSPGTGNQRASIELAGYVVTLPAGYRLAPGATNCNKGIAPSSGTRVIPPGSSKDCPLAIQSVVANLPAGTDAWTVTVHVLSGQNTNVTVFVTRSGSQVTTYFPARLPSGRTVYVSIGSGPTSVGGPAVNIQQASELAQGLAVSPATPCTNPSGC